jgi:SAM-dependent methyltransferase
MNPTQAVDHNRAAWDQRAARGERFTKPISKQELSNAKQIIDPWVKDEGLEGKSVLCLGAGGGRQGAAYAAAGAASVMVVDVSPRQLLADQQVAEDFGLPIRTCPTSMDDLSDLHDASFDIVVHPVSTCYVPCLERVYRESARVLRPGGLYVSQHKQPTSLQGSTRPGARGYEIVLPYDSNDPLPQVSGSLHREPGTAEFLHTWDQLVGQLCRSGFVIEDLSEPEHGDRTAKPGTFGHRSLYLPPYVRIKARRTNQKSAPAPIITEH